MSRDGSVRSASWFKRDKQIASLLALVTASLLAGGCVPAEGQQAVIPAPPPPNNPPIIISLEADPVLVGTWDISRVTCLAADVDGDELTYEWSASQGDIYGEGPAINWGAPVTEGIFKVEVKVNDSNGGAATGSVSVSVRDNLPPAITSLKGDENWLSPGGCCRFECQAEDPNGDSLTYEWSADAGEFFGVGPAVIWLAPEVEGIYRIAVTVTDDFGKTSTRWLYVSASVKPPPVIEGFIATSEDTKYLREIPGGYKIFRGRSCQIQCVVAGASDELSYEWSADMGEITYDGPVATWRAPSSRGDATITVIVSDEVGNKASESVVFKIETCACAF